MHRSLAPSFVLACALAGACGMPARQQPAPAPANVVAEVRAAIAAGDRDKGAVILKDYRAAHGDTPEAIEALSWLARGSLAAKDLDTAERQASEAYKLSVAALSRTKLADDAHLQTALGASIETGALVAVEHGERTEAVSFLRTSLETYRDTPIHKRLAKNLNLLSLEGQPAPPLETSEYLDRPAPSFAQLSGKVVVLFFWAHWCPDCKIESPILAKLLDKYRAQGVEVIAPTQRYGYVVEGKSAAPDEELRHIVEVRDHYYAFLENQPVPVSEANHKLYGVASTPTIVLVDRKGLVRVYHPGRMTEEELESAIRALL
jgi:thiol-disulfide isomerase/thioredoxin